MRRGLGAALAAIEGQFYPSAEAEVLALAHAYERAAEWHKRQPPIRPDTPVPKLAEVDDDSRSKKFCQSF
jgi:hypothetical protein